VTARDAEKNAVYSIVFGAPARPWGPREARAWLETLAAGEPCSVEPLDHQGRQGFALVASSAGRMHRARLFLDGPRVLCASVVSVVEDGDASRFFRSLDFSTRTLVAPALALRR
jgi:hypothetical protein